MPEPRKRRMIEEEEEEEEYIVKGTPSNGTKSAKEKAPKRAKHKEVVVEESPKELEEEEEDDDEIGREEPEGWHDVEDTHEKNADDLEWLEKANRDFETSKTTPGRHGAVAEMGVIEMIEMHDFMCHRHLKVPFGPKINFIIGHNGSGKSAILTAIMVCLGGKASVTNRGHSLKALIREGATQTDVRLQLRNRGNDGYKPDIYGESIIVERRISLDGGSSYKIKNAKGKTISTKRDDLAAILDHMNIQVDNPINVLSQDSARQFLQSSTPADKYNSFNKGTQLHQLSQDYEHIRDCIDMMQTTMKKKNEALPELLHLAKEAQARFKDSQQAATLELKVEEMKKEIVWVQIEDLEGMVTELRKELEGHEARVPAIENRRTGEEQKLATLDEEVRALELTAREQTDSTAPFQEEKRGLELKMREKREELKTLHEEEKTVNDEIKVLKDRIRGYEQTIEQELKKLQSNGQPRKAEIENNIKQLEDEMEVGKRKYAETKENLALLEQKQEDLNNRSEQANSLVARAQRERKDNNERIQQLMSQKQNSLRAFGQSIPDVLRDIDEVTKRRGWKGEAPTGPLGRHVKLKEKNYKDIIEAVLSPVMNAFAVTHDQDRSTLLNILRRNKCQSDIILTRKVIFDYRDKEPSDRYLTINRALEFDDEWVRRLMIDKNAIESTILVATRREGDVVTSSGPGGRFPTNVSACFSKDMWRVGDRAGGASSSSVNRYRGPPRLAVNVEQEAQQLEGNGRRLEETLRYRMKEFNELGKEVETTDRERIQTKRQLANMEKELKLKTKAIDELRVGLEEDEPVNIQMYEESKQKDVEEMETMKKQYEPILAQKQVIKDSMRALQQQVVELNESIQSQESKANRLQDDLETLNQKREEYLTRIQHWDKKLDRERAIIAQSEKELQASIQKLEVSTEQALEYCERVEVTQSKKDLETKIKAMQAKLLAQEKARGATVEEIVLDMQRKQEEYKTARDSINHMNQFIDHLKPTLHHRISRWREFRNQMSLRSAINFSLLLAFRKYSGELQFKHPEKELTIKVETDDPNSAQAGVSRDKDPKSLSGGEKSFSTICFLLALWNSMASTIRCLDEFDVFMDAVNRRISMSMLIDAAREADGVQFILITPQDASSVNPGPDVRVHRLHDPERNQGVLM
ncbi:Structural maintenance of chromosomes protein 6 [Mortierella hygrophila]|uniref:Structural maintenance of chromosomes protein 6 n=1 Tax=Mortierella hygrophila TaxID=979708 RepID=A0A9P6F7V8_9FUNG|nr:Structural maintenance of chromosomes protein 6 [Mortierella hygrophila]